MFDSTLYNTHKTDKWKMRQKTVFELRFAKTRYRILVHAR